MGGGFVARAGGREAPVYPARPKWGDVSLFYPTENSAWSMVGYSSSSLKNADHVSAIRISIALILAGMKRAFVNASDAKPVGTIVLRTNPNGTENLMYGSKFFANVEKLKNWLLKKDIWHDAEDGVNGTIVNSAHAMKKMKDRCGVIIIERNGSNYASLWDIDKIVDGGNIIDGDTVYFWELDKNSEQYQNIEDARMAAAKRIARCVYGYTEYSISIFKIGDDHFCLSSIKNGKSDSIIPDYELAGHELAAIVHTHAEDRNATNESKLLSQEFSAADKIVSYAHNIPVSIVTSDRKIKTIVARVNDDDIENAKEMVAMLMILKKIDNGYRLNEEETKLRDKRWATENIDEIMKNKDSLEMKRKLYEEGIEGYINECKEVKPFTQKVEL